MKRLFIFLFSLSLILVSCRFVGMDFVGSKVKIDNQTDNYLAAYVNINYPDTTKKLVEYSGFIEPNSIQGIGLVNLYWDTVFKSTPKVTIFIVKRNEKDDLVYSISKNDEIKNKIILSKKDLEEMKWKIILK